MIRTVRVFLQIFCFFGCLLFIKLIKYAPISNNALYFLGMLFIAYQIVIRLFFHIDIDNLDKNDKAQLIYAYLPLFCIESAIFIYYRNAVFSLIKELLQINGL